MISDKDDIVISDLLPYRQGECKFLIKALICQSGPAFCAYVKRATALFRITRALHLILLASLLCGCQERELVSMVTRDQAIEIVAVLAQEGIAAEMRSDSTGQNSGDATQAVWVANSGYGDAMQILHARQLPGTPPITFKDAIGTKGFLPDSTRVEQVRLDRAEAIELEELIKDHPHIKSAHAIVRRRVTDTSNTSIKPSASVVITGTEQLTATEKLGLHELVKNTLSGIDQNDIFLLVAASSQGEESPLSETSKQSAQGVERIAGEVRSVPLESFLFFWRVPSSDAHGVALSAIGIVLAGVLLGMLLGNWFPFSRLTTMKRNRDTSPQRMDVTSVVKRP